MHEIESGTAETRARSDELIAACRRTNQIEDEAQRMQLDSLLEHVRQHHDSDSSQELAIRSLTITAAMSYLTMRAMRDNSLRELLVTEW